MSPERINTTVRWCMRRFVLQLGMIRALTIATCWFLNMFSREIDAFAVLEIAIVEKDAFTKALSPRGIRLGLGRAQASIIPSDITVQGEDGAARTSPRRHQRQLECSLLGA
jgi:hypothetical protein